MEQKLFSLFAQQVQQAKHQTNTQLTFIKLSSKSYLEKLTDRFFK